MTRTRAGTFGRITTGSSITTNANLPASTNSVIGVSRPILTISAWL